MTKAADFKPQHFKWEVQGKVATITLNRPERKNPLTFESYAELRDTFRALNYVDDVKTVVVTGAGENFCSGGDAHEIIGPLTQMKMPGLLEFTRMTGDLVKAMRACPQPIVAAIDGICAGAGAMIACGSDMRYGTARSKVAFLFVRVGLAGADMGACSLLPRIIGQGRASELLYTGRSMGGRGSRAFRFLQRHPRAGKNARCRAGYGARIGRWADVCPRHDQKAVASRVEHGPRRSHRSRSRSTGHLHADAGFPSRVSRICQQAEAGV